MHEVRRQRLVRATFRHSIAFNARAIVLRPYVTERELPGGIEASASDVMRIALDIGLGVLEHRAETWRLDPRRQR